LRKSRKLYDQFRTNQLLHCTADSLATVRLHVTQLVVETNHKAIIVRFLNFVIT